MSKYAIDFSHGVVQDRRALGFIAEESIINEVSALVKYINNCIYRLYDSYK